MISVPRRAMFSGWGLVAVAGSSIFLGCVVVSTIAISSGTGAGEVPGLCIAIFSFSGLGFAWWAVKRSADRRTRSAWIWIASSVTLLSLSGVLFNMVPTATFPRPGDFPRLLLVPLLLTGLLRLPTRSQVSPVSRLKLALDSGTVAVAAAIFLWYIQVGPAVTGPGVNPQRVLASTAYPLGDVLLIFGVAVVLTRGVDAASRRPMWLVATATVPWIVGDTFVGFAQSNTERDIAYGWEMLCFLAAHFLLAAAAFEQCRRGRSHDDLVALDGPSISRVSRLPYLAVGSGFGLMLFVAAWEDAVYPWGGLVLCATLLTAIVAVRQVIAQRENHQMVITDGLTGLANRMRLHQALSLALARGARSQHITGVLLADLNGFKQINDTLGHEAGDKLLIAFGEMLRRSILGSDLAGRLGGDEFAVVLHDIRSGDSAEAVVRRIIHETTQPVMVGDTLVPVRASIGIALCAPGELGLDALIHHADVAMYQAKAQSRLTGTSAFHHYDAAEVARAQHQQATARG